ncbi:hypothetical protein RclHR1_06650006 [Rhizophagus clarus]|uniref:Uncharacterized protein n=1 Tax=Rhizophagus clarus TaxID=94130 RepID=A0A2Z6RT30_9GLOM|nr:hypothetical protein RclHR1_06650006 [Rhizophagus clarus]GES95377.1 hypothetical protein RCL_jg9679.t1 [Rhizophagus clarus]
MIRKFTGAFRIFIRITKLKNIIVEFKTIVYKVTCKIVDVRDKRDMVIQHLLDEATEGLEVMQKYLGDMVGGLIEIREKIKRLRIKREQN